MLEHKVFKILVETIQDLVDIRCCETSMWESVIKGWRVKFPTKHYQNNCPSFTGENLVTGVYIETLLILWVWTTFWLIVTWFPSLIWIFFIMGFCPNWFTIIQLISLNVITVATLPISDNVKSMLLFRWLAVIMSNNLWIIDNIHQIIKWSVMTLSGF